MWAGRRKTIGGGDITGGGGGDITGGGVWSYVSRLAEGSDSHEALA
jgi:hypothetical protein